MAIGIRISGVLLASALSLSGSAFAVTVTLPDSCAGVATANQATLSVDQNGNVTVNPGTGASAPGYVALFGCDPTPPAVPSCSLSASRTSLSPGGTTTLFAKCSSNASSYSWNGPSDSPQPVPPPQSGTFSFPVTFPTSGAFTYSVAASNSTGQGPVSNQLTILVGDNTVTPKCTLTASPTTLNQNAKSRLQVTCNPVATGYSWVSEPGAPPMTGSGAELTFQTAGAFTYKVQGVNAVGTGPVATAAVTVAAVISPPGVSKAFSPTSPNAGVAVTLTITLTNSNASPITAASLTDTYPSGLVNAPTPAATTTCTGGTASATAGGSSLSLSGATIPANGSCTVRATVVASASGYYVNTLPAGAVSSSAGASTAAASATLVVQAGPAFQNASFEAPVLAAGTYRDPFPNGYNWTPTWVTGLVTSGYFTNQGDPAPPHGSQAAYVGNGSSLSQSIFLPAGTYAIRFSAMGTQVYPSTGVFATVRFGATQILTTPIVPSAWTTFTTQSFVVPSGTSYLFTFGVGGDGYMYFDDIRVVPQ
jgi:uncharacterized repeat protein (TIGR01451 family)